MNRRGFFSRMAGLLGIPFIPDVPSRPAVRDTGAITLTNFNAKVPGDSCCVTYFAFKGDSQWKRVDLCDILGEKEDSDA